MKKELDYQAAMRAYKIAEARPMRPDTISPAELLANFHPDHIAAAHTTLKVGPNAGAECQIELADMLQSNACISERDLAGAPIHDVDVLVVGGGGAGCAAAITVAEAGARVVLLNKLRLGDSNTVMAEGGIQASIEADDSPQRHFDDTFKGGHNGAAPELVATMVKEGPETISWLIRQGMQFEQIDTTISSPLATKRAGGTSAARILFYKDYTGLEMMRVLREAVVLEPAIDIWERSPLVELLSDGQGNCVGAVCFSMDRKRYTLIRCSQVILATGGLGRMHLNGFPTSNHFGSMGDGLALAYRMGAKLVDLDTFQYHPTGLAWPRHRLGCLVTEAIRSSGCQLINARGERFVDELKTRDQVAAAIIRECREGRGIRLDEQSCGVFLDLPTLLHEQPELIEQYGSLRHLAEKCSIDPFKTPFVVFPTLHYQNGGVSIDTRCRTNVPGLLCAGELTGGIHGRNRLMGNALLDIIVFGRRAGAEAAAGVRRGTPARIGIEHVRAWQRLLTAADLSLERRAPLLYPKYANYDHQRHGQEVS
jgi:L-aspartate oxidase